MVRAWLDFLRGLPFFELDLLVFPVFDPDVFFWADDVVLLCDALEDDCAGKTLEWSSSATRTVAVKRSGNIVFSSVPRFRRLFSVASVSTFGSLTASNCGFLTYSPKGIS